MYNKADKYVTIGEGGRDSRNPKHFQGNSKESRGHVQISQVVQVVKISASSENCTSVDLYVSSDIESDFLKIPKFEVKVK